MRRYRIPRFMICIIFTLFRGSTVPDNSIWNASELPSILLRSHLYGVFVPLQIFINDQCVFQLPSLNPFIVRMRHSRNCHTTVCHKVAEAPGHTPCAVYLSNNHSYYYDKRIISASRYTVFQTGKKFSGEQKQSFRIKSGSSFLNNNIEALAKHYSSYGWNHGNLHVSDQSLMPPKQQLHSRFARQK